MTQPEFPTSIIIPAYNEENRLGHTLEALLEFIEKKVFKCADIKEVLIIDDGSHDKTAHVASTFHSSSIEIRVIRSPRNFGKGHAVRIGLTYARYPWVLMADADMSTPWTEVDKLFEYIKKHSAQIAIGSRDLKESNIKIRQSWVREHMGKTFNLLVRMLSGLNFKDTQCGFKLFHKNHVLQYIKFLKVNDFAWDVEFLLYAKKYKVVTVEVPIQWNHMDKSHVHPIKDGARMLLTLIQVSFRK